VSDAFRCHALLNGLLADIYGGVDQGDRREPGSVWWEVEQSLYERDRWRPSLSELCRMAGVSPATLARLCRDATEQSPVKRVSELRMRHALGLLQYSPMSVTETATHLGYPRMHEFSREFARHYGYPPSRVKSEM
jgi:AraC-like DNA-binding protein